MAEYSREVLRVVVAQICQTIGWHSINSTPLEFMVDLMQEYFLRIYKLSHQYAEILGRTEVNLDDLGLAFQHMSIDLQQLSEYVRNVDSVPCAVPVPRFPLTRENHLNFLKPGSREVVTRQVHIHEHLPAMHPELEDIQIDEVPEHLENEPTTPGKSFPTPSLETSPSILSSPETIFKRPGDPLSDSPGMSKRTKINDESRALRELHSVMMTRAGFLSPAREGKLPESRTPDQSNPDSPTPSSYPMVPPELKTEKKPKKIVKKNLEDRKLDKENKKKNRDKDLFKPDKINEPKVKKLAGMKETAKLKALKPGGGKGSGPSPSTSPTFPINTAPQKDESRKITKNISPKMKAEKITPPVSIKEEDTFGKLPSEPDKQKLNIFKKISKTRDDKNSDISLNDQIKYEDLRRRAVSPPIAIANDEAEKTPRADMETRREEKKIPHTPDVHMPIDADIVDLRSPSPDVYVFDDMSPPGTPSTPKTPELNVPGPALESKKKRKEKNSRKKDNIKSPSFKETPLKGKMMHDMMETEVLGRPKTPEALETPIHKEMNIPSALPFPFFPTFPTAPGLIPHPIGHPMFPRFPLPLGPRGAPNPHIPQIMHNLPLTPRFMPPPMKMDDFPVPKMKSLDQVPINIPEKISIVDELPRVEIEKIGKANKIPKAEKCSVPPIVKAAAPKSDSFVPPQETPLQKLEKLERMDKKSKKHKIEKKEKLKKKKEKKDKHKEKPEKSKEKKEKIEKMKEKKEKKDKRKDKEEKEAEAVPKITLKLATASPRPPTPDNPLMKKITIKPLPKKPEGIIKRESSPELAKISPLVTRPPKQKTPKVKTESVSKKDEPKDSEIRAALLEPPPATIVDQKGRQVWICPACGSQDDGSPMIGCDDCDAWYHWVCVGMQVPPADKEDWYCRFCIAKKQELHHDKKKKKRKKKVKLPV